MTTILLIAYAYLSILNGIYCVLFQKAFKLTDTPAYLIFVFLINTIFLPISLTMSLHRLHKYVKEREKDT